MHQMIIVISRSPLTFPKGKRVLFKLALMRLLELL